jgi:hypothetical protein
MKKSTKISLAVSATTLLIIGGIIGVNKIKYAMKADIEPGPYIWQNKATSTYNQSDSSESNSIYFKKIWVGLLKLHFRPNKELPIKIEVGSGLSKKGELSSSIDSSGNISIDPTQFTGLSSELSGQQDIYVTPSGYLRKKITPTFPLADGTLFDFSQNDPFLPGDFSGDNIVNENDISQLINNFNNYADSKNNIDVNGDGTINMADLSIILPNYQKTGD